MIQKAAFSPFAKNDYPTTDGRPMAETDLHRNLMVALIEMLQTRYEHDPMAYVSGDLLIFYEVGNKRRHVAPDVFVVFGVSKGERDNYLLWEEKPIDVVIEVTSKTTKAEDLKKKPILYRERLGVKEYYLFDPTEDYLNPSLQGFRLVRNEYRPIKLVGGRLTSKVLGLELERDGSSLRLWDPGANQWLKTEKENHHEAKRQVEDLQQQLDELRRRLGT